jgi:diguanylate cyclase (GGDEF)-like protein
MKVLLVDDDEVDRELVVRTLARSTLNAEIFEALTVDEGLDLYSQHNFDVILLDFNMPRRDGIEMIVEIRNEPKDSSTAIVMMSTSEDEELALRCIKAGAQDYLIKSEISGPRLKRAILHATARFELERQLFQSYQRVKTLAETDPLTTLPNRYFFDESLKQAITNNQRSQHKLALLLLDLDNFKIVNDTFGHDVGDLLIKRMVMRIKGCLRGNELFARLGGDEFGITLANLESAENASVVAQRIVTIMMKPMEIAGTTVHVTTSIGIALHPENGFSSEVLFKHADIAMYRAKTLGKNQVCFYEEKMQESFHERLKIEHELREAITSQQFRLAYQPIYASESNKLVGFEALIRWELGNLIHFPDYFIEIAEDNKQIIEIGRWVLREAISQLAIWNEKRSEKLTMAINISAIQLADEKLVDYFVEAISEFKVPAKLIDLEITETALLENSTTTTEQLIDLNELGFRLSLDDFGTGFSSIAHLRHYPISIVKIDKSLMPVDEKDVKNIALLEGLVSMIQRLGLDIVAEGVETEIQARLCSDLRVTFLQGYYYDKPLAVPYIEKQLLM